MAAAVARHAASRTPYDGAVEEAGRGVRAMIDGAEARLGSLVAIGKGDVPELHWYRMTRTPPAGMVVPGLSTQPVFG